MMEHIKIKKLISSDYDGIATKEERALIQEHLQGCPSCAKFYNELHKLSFALKNWKDEEVSPDLTQRLERSLFGIKEEKTMNQRTLALSAPLRVIAFVAMLGVVGILSHQVYTKSRSQNQLAQFNEMRRSLNSGTKTVTSNGEVKELVKADVSLTRPAMPAGLEEGKVKGSETVAYSSQIIKDNAISRNASLALKSELGRVGYSILKPDKNVSVYEKDALISSNFVPVEDFNREQYARIYDNPFLEVTENPLSTFSIDVDTASYSNVRRFLNNNQMPPADAVRIEEMINYFTYDYPKPQGSEPFSVTTRLSICPWMPDHQLIQIGMQGKVLKTEKIPASNLVFLMDVSGSMDDPNKLPLLQSAFKLLVNQLRDEEKVAIVVYAGAAGVVLESTAGSDKLKILQAIEQLHAGGSTAGGAGIQLAYDLARKNFIQDGNNRVILATDGDFNVGVSSDGELVRLIEDKRQEGIFLTVLGFGTGNYQDTKMEKLAEKGNGNYYYIDTMNEARKVLVHELGSTLFTIAKDVKIQIEFNPVQVKAYRLIGYENRILAKEDFNDDKKDAGEMGAGHSVTALYEIVPAGSKETFVQVDELEYQKREVVNSDELMSVKLRYKEPDGDTSQLIKETVKAGAVTDVPDDLSFAQAVAQFGLLLRDSAHKAQASYADVLKGAEAAKGADTFGYRTEFIELVKKAQQLDTRASGSGIIFKGQGNK